MIIPSMYIRVISRLSDNFGEASFDVEFGIELKNVGFVLVRRGLWQLDQNEIFVQNILKVDFQHFFYFYFGQFFFSAEALQSN